MRPNLSFEKFTAVLASLGASVAIGCGGGTPQPVAVAPGTGAASMATPSAAPTAAPGAANVAAAAPAASTATATEPSSAASKPAAKAPKKDVAPKVAPAGEASCGAGTCSTDVKKKIL
jgi:hypothetical protein